MRFLAMNFSSSKAVLPYAVLPLEWVKRVFCELALSSHINTWNDSDDLQSSFTLKHPDFFPPNTKLTCYGFKNPSPLKQALLCFGEQTSPHLHLLQAGSL